MRAILVTGEILREVVVRVIVDPIRGGRLRTTGWPPGLAAVVLIGIIVYSTGLLGAGLSDQLRIRLEHDSVDGFPPALFGFAIVMVTIVVALVCTGSLHAPWPLRLVGLLVALTVLVDVSTWTLTWWSVLVQLGFWMLLVLFAVMRWRRGFAWWEYLVVQAILGAALALATWQGIRPGLDRQFLVVTDLAVLLLASLAVFALPTAMTAGVALTEVAFGTAVWLVEIVSQRVRPAFTAALTLVLAILAGAVTAWQFWRSALPVKPHLISTVAAGAVAVVVAVAWRLIDRVADRRGPESTRLHQLGRRSRRVSVVCAIVVTLPVMLSELLNIFRLASSELATTLGLDGLLLSVVEPSDPVARGVGLVAAVIVAVPVVIVAATRAVRGTTELIMVVGLLSIVRGGGLLGWLPVILTLDDLSAAWIVATLAVAAVWLVRRSMSPRRTEAIAVLLAFGLIWALLTGAEDANVDSQRFPQSARVLLVVANSAVVMTVLGAAVRDEEVIEPTQRSGASV